MKEKERCGWARSVDAEYTRYHDEEWGVPSRDDRHLFEFLVLEAAQAGLAWSTILRKRDGYRKAFAGFDPAKVARFDAAKEEKLMLDAGIVRNRLKISSTVTNAAAFRAVQKEHGSFATYLWQFVGDTPLQTKRKTMADVPAETDLAKTISKDLKKRGFRFVGPTIIYAYMQAVGLVNDHLVTCFRHRDVARLT